MEKYLIEVWREKRRKWQTRVPRLRNLSQDYILHLIATSFCWAITYCILEYVYELYYPIIYDNISSTCLSSSIKVQSNDPKQHMLNVSKMVQQFDKHYLQTHERYYVDILTIID